MRQPRSATMCLGDNSDLPLRPRSTWGQPAVPVSSTLSAGQSRKESYEHVSLAFIQFWAPELRRQLWHAVCLIVNQRHMLLSIYASFNIFIFLFNIFPLFDSLISTKKNVLEPYLITYLSYPLISMKFIMRSNFCTRIPEDISSSLVWNKHVFQFLLLQLSHDHHGHVLSLLFSLKATVP